MTDRGADPDGRRGPRDDPELTVLVEELSTTLETLQGTFDEGSRDRRVGPRGPTPPSPRELLRFTEQYTIPTLVALLESGIRSLELLRATLRLLDGRGIEETSPAARERVESVGRTTLDRVDRVLSDLGSAVEGGEPADPDARDLLSDARSLRDEIDRRLREAEADERSRTRERDWDGTARRTSGRVPAEGRNIPVRSADRSDREADDGDGADGDVPVDVDAELESIREDVARERGGTSSNEGPADAARDADGDGDGGSTGGGDDPRK